MIWAATAPPFLIAHATGMCGRAYEPMAAVVAQSFHVYAIDFRGHGDSTSPDDGDFAWAGMGADVLAAVEAIGVDRIDVFGHSLGGASLLIAESVRPGVATVRVPLRADRHDRGVPERPHELHVRRGAAATCGLSVEE